MEDADDVSIFYDAINKDGLSKVRHLRKESFSSSNEFVFLGIKGEIHFWRFEHGTTRSNKLIGKSIRDSHYANSIVSEFTH